jgi:hypothetical protein
MNLLRDWRARSHLFVVASLVVDGQRGKFYSTATLLAMTTLASPLRSSKLQDLMEDLGFDMDAIPDTNRHELVRPVGLQMIDLIDPGPDPDGVRRGSYAVEGTSILAWQAFQLEDVDPTSTTDCLWDFVRAADATPQDALAFVKRWGVYERPQHYLGAGSWQVADFLEQADFLRTVLICLVSTASGETLNDGLFAKLAERDYYLDLGLVEDGEEILRRLNVDPDEADRLPDGITFPVMRDVRMDRWLAQRAAGDGLQLQARIFTSLLNAEIDQSAGAFIWDARGRRRAEKVATGVRAIAWAHIAALFTKSNLDIFRCDVCGNPFSFESLDAQRRPRRGKRRFCTDLCRLKAKREANREAWRQNGVKWRPPGSRTSAGKKRTNEQAV